MILIVVVRRAICEVCHGQFDLAAGEKPPKECKLCGSLLWEFGPRKSDVLRIQEGRTKVKRKLNPGAKSKKRQDRAKKQWRQLKPKPLDNKDGSANL